MRRPNRATVGDDGLGAAFARGVNEGFRLTGHVLLLVTVGGEVIIHQTVESAKVAELATEVLGQFRGEHYAAGVVIRIMAAEEAKSAPEPAKVDHPAIGEDGIEDAEIVDD